MPSSKKTKQKPAKTSKLRVITGGVKKLSRVKQGYLALVALLLVTSVGFGGYGYVQDREWKAQAASSRRIVSPGSYPAAYACRIYLRAYGGVNIVRVSADRNYPFAKTTQQMVLNSWRNGNPVDSYGGTFRTSRITGTVNTSAYFNDKYYVRFKKPIGSWKQYGPFSALSLPHCS